MDNIKKIFEDHPEREAAWETADGQVFFTENLASNHARGLADKTLKKHSRKAAAGVDTKAGPEPTPEPEAGQEIKIPDADPPKVTELTPAQKAAATRAAKAAAKAAASN